MTIHSERQVLKNDLVTHNDVLICSMRKFEIATLTNDFNEILKPVQDNINCEFRKYIASIPKTINSQLRTDEHDSKLDNKTSQFSTSIAPVLQQLPSNTSDSRNKSCQFNSKTALVFPSQSQLHDKEHQFIFNIASVLQSQKQLHSVVSDKKNKRCQFNTSAVSELNSSNQLADIKSKQDKEERQFKLDPTLASQCKNKQQPNNNSVYENKKCQFNESNAALVMQKQNQPSGIVFDLLRKFIHTAKALPKYCKAQINCPERFHCNTTKIINTKKSVLEYCKPKLKCPKMLKRWTIKLNNSIQTVFQNCKSIIS